MERVLQRLNDGCQLAQLNSRIPTYGAPLGIQWQCSALLGQYLRRKGQPSLLLFTHSILTLLHIQLQRIERQIHHYGSGLNALPLLEQFMMNPTDTYLLRVGFGGVSGPSTNINEDGFAAASFHSFEDTLQWDGYSGDYGPNAFGLCVGTTMFLVDMPDFGWQAFGGIVTSTSPTVKVTVKDAVQRRIFVAPIGQLLSLDAGVFSSLEYDASARTVTVGLAAAASAPNAASAPQGRLLVKQTAAISGVALLTPSSSLKQDAGAWDVPFSSGKATVVLRY